MNWVIIFGIVASLLQLYVAFLAYKIWKSGRLSGWWWALIVAFVIQLIRRLISLYQDVGLNVVENSVLFDRGLAVLISLLIAIGLYEMLRKFDSFEIVAKEAERVAKAIKRKK